MSVLEDKGRKATVKLFTNELGKLMTVPVVTAAVTYDFKYTGKTYTLLIYNSLYFQNMYTNLVPPIMMRLTGIDMVEFPMFLSRKPMEINHSV